ncbi:type II toxin-antitoxin system VapC family toxin [Enterovirga rhinocerotis]|uniref:PIN domain nuclease of toxin-antitoxin system n=1 Tax=Enterovirga rhinocerotis TaxID=1339210 RepID=A0A4R7BQS6_9HYPH|nr:type II toxin-antitoxin system VapC family toxin [Enterovirga rhinocerotis]TDR88010.1 PIN domain nuclease of toxin-antitoxin system [Enterovirga rhinocerotis]
MNLLLDSHALMWWAMGQGALRPDAIRAIDTATSVSASLAMPWELQIKVKLGKLDLGRARWQDIEESGVAFLAPTLADVLLAADLPLHHRDPFDRLIVAQAMQRHLVIVTRDAIFARYGIATLAA